MEFHKQPFTFLGCFALSPSNRSAIFKDGCRIEGLTILRLGKMKEGGYSKWRGLFTMDKSQSLAWNTANLLLGFVNQTWFKLMTPIPTDLPQKLTCLMGKIIIWQLWRLFLLVQFLIFVIFLKEEEEIGISPTWLRSIINVDSPTDTDSWVCILV